jgi:hypothetical protein
VVNDPEFEVDSSSVKQLTGRRRTQDAYDDDTMAGITCLLSATVPVTAQPAHLHLRILVCVCTTDKVVNNEEQLGVPIVSIAVLPVSNSDNETTKIEMKLAVGWGIGTAFILLFIVFQCMG